jgi:hypothetical protein
MVMAMDPVTAARAGHGGGAWAMPAAVRPARPVA